MDKNDEDVFDAEGLRKDLDKYKVVVEEMQKRVKGLEEEKSIYDYTEQELEVKLFLTRNSVESLLFVINNKTIMNWNSVKAKEAATNMLKRDISKLDKNATIYTLRNLTTFIVF